MNHEIIKPHYLSPSSFYLIGLFSHEYSEVDNRLEKEKKHVQENTMKIGKCRKRPSGDSLPIEYGKKFSYLRLKSFSSTFPPPLSPYGTLVHVVYLLKLSHTHIRSHTHSHLYGAAFSTFVDLLLCSATTRLQGHISTIYNALYLYIVMLLQCGMVLLRTFVESQYIQCYTYTHVLLLPLLLLWRWWCSFVFRRAYYSLFINFKPDSNESILYYYVLFCSMLLRGHWLRM